MLFKEKYIYILRHTCLRIHGIKIEEISVTFSM